MPPAPPRPRPPSALVPSLPAHDLAATRDFYVRDLGLAVTDEASGRLRVRVGTATLEFRQHDGPPPQSDGLLLTFACPDPEALLKRLRALSVELDVPPSPAGDVHFFARDPDDRLVAFTAARPRAAQ